jgi:hypothetical protein
MSAIQISETKCDKCGVRGRTEGTTHQRLPLGWCAVTVNVITGAPHIGGHSPQLDLCPMCYPVITVAEVSARGFGSCAPPPWAQ